MSDRELLSLPDDLPRPVDDHAADHLPGAMVPAIALPATTGGMLQLGIPRDTAVRQVVFAYPRTGRPGEPPLVSDWDSIPGARGCTPESCGFRDAHAYLTGLGAEVVGLSTQTTADQSEAAQRLVLTFPLISDAELRLTRALRLPTFTAAGETLLKRLTLVLRDGVVEHVFYPVFPPDAHAQEVAAWLAARQ